MEVKLDKLEIEHLQKQIIDSLRNEALNLARQEINRFIHGGQLIGEIRNEIVKQCVPEIKDKVMKKLVDDDHVIKKALQSAEQRINNQIHAKMINGITVKF